MADYEVIVVNDGSHDNTAEVLEELRSTYGRACEWSRTRRIAAMAERCAAASRRRRKEFVFYTDGDGQYDVGELPRLLAWSGPIPAW